MKLVRLKLVALELKLVALVLLVALGAKPTALARELKTMPPLAPVLLEPRVLLALKAPR